MKMLIMFVGPLNIELDDSNGARIEIGFYNNGEMSFFSHETIFGLLSNSRRQRV